MITDFGTKRKRKIRLLIQIVKNVVSYHEKPKKVIRFSKNGEKRNL